jgi:hypothetical protein
MPRGISSAADRSQPPRSPSWPRGGAVSLNVKESLGTALDRLLTDRQVTAGDAEEIATRILHQNAAELYPI